LAGLPCARIGESSPAELVIDGAAGNMALRADIAELKAAWQSTRWCKCGGLRNKATPMLLRDTTQRARRISLLSIGSLFSIVSILSLLSAGSIQHRQRRFDSQHRQCRFDSQHRQRRLDSPASAAPAG
jgi:hypothetical protein